MRWTPVCASGRSRTRRRAINSGFLLGPMRHGSKATWTFSRARLLRKATDSDKETTEDSNDCNPLWYAWIPILQVRNKRSSAQVPHPQGSVTSFWSSAPKRATGPHAACTACASTKYQLMLALRKPWRGRDVLADKCRWTQLYFNERCIIAVLQRLWLRWYWRERSLLALCGAKQTWALVADPTMRLSHHGQPTWVYKLPLASLAT